MVKKMHINFYCDKKINMFIPGLVVVLTAIAFVIAVVAKVPMNFVHFRLRFYVLPTIGTAIPQLDLYLPDYSDSILQMN